MTRITTAAALRMLAEQILETIKNAQTFDEPYFVDFDKTLAEIEKIGER